MYALLLPIEKGELAKGIDELMDLIAVHPETGDMLTFKTIEEADSFRESHTIDCKIIELFVL